MNDLQDLRGNLSLYPRVNGSPDRNIDFRRVLNLIVYFERKAVSLTLNPLEIAEWQPGDIVVYEDNHMALSRTGGTCKASRISCITRDSLIAKRMR